MKNIAAFKICFWTISHTGGLPYTTFSMNYLVVDYVWILLLVLPWTQVILFNSVTSYRQSILRNKWNGGQLKSLSIIVRSCLSSILKCATSSAVPNFIKGYKIVSSEMNFFLYNYWFLFKYPWNKIHAWPLKMHDYLEC